MAEDGNGQEFLNAIVTKAKSWFSLASVGAVALILIALDILARYDIFEFTMSFGG